ncbi:unnamed protein product [Caenorhabditis auriculariae]|uniref:Phospholipase A2 n=1 Tax=Caenorhabditis auriculariae TaxID=2777116 RepID=A0A8S1HDA1_9PELO|nr:unnamed protein product [Caenorhabditis auriculariae]
MLWLLILAGVVSGTFIRKNDTIMALWNLEEMAECRLHYNALVYNNYGCWCGVGGSHTPVDGIDECCMHHDKCYDAAVDKRICYDVEIEYVDDYSWLCQRNSTTSTEPICSAKNAGCKAALCECDRIVVDCWSKFPRPLLKPRCNRSNWTPLTRHFQH